MIMVDKAPSGISSHAGHKDSPMLLEACNIWHSYDGKTHILKGVDLGVKEGLFTMLLGRSASGKTTLIKVLAGVLKPSQGTVTVRPGCPGSNQRIAYIPQNLGLVRNLTALNNVLIGALGFTKTLPSLLNQFNKHTVDQARSILNDLGIGAKADHKIWHLSGGERQRVAIARALIQNPRIILADEFVSQLDPVTSMEILSIMKGLTEARIAFLITTHDVALAQEYADRIIVMKNGHIAHEHGPDDMSADAIMDEIK